MKKDWEIYRDTGILGGYMPECAKLRQTEDGEVATVYRDTTTRIEGDCIAKQREMLIGSNGSVSRLYFRQSRLRRQRTSCSHTLMRN